MRRKNDDESSLSHTRWNCQYHIVFTPKYRRKAIYNYGNRHFWAEGYFVSTVGANKATIYG